MIETRSSVIIKAIKYGLPLHFPIQLFATDELFKDRAFSYTYRRRFARSKKLECDHIIPKSLYGQQGYKYDTLENKIKATLEFFHNHKNLRTLCSDCHKQVTAKYLSDKFKVKELGNSNIVILSEINDSKIRPS